MVFTRRVAMLLALVACGLLAVTGTVGAQGPFTPAGDYHNKSVTASMFIFSGPPNFNVTVTNSTNTSNPLVGPSSSTNEIDVQFNACDALNNVCGGGCFIAAPSEFAFSSDLSSATLNATFVQGVSQPCQNQPVTFFLPSPLPTPFSFTLTARWTNTGPVGSSRGISRYACGGYTDETQTTSSFANGTTATGQISLLPASTFGPTGANLFTFDQTINAQGAADPTCEPVGGKGAGPGPLSQGNFHFVNQSAFVPLPNGMNLELSKLKNTSSPRGSAPTTQSETDLTFSQFGFFGFEQACFVLPPSASTIGTTSASVSITIDASSNPCQGPPNDLTLPATVNVNVSWTASGVLATFASNNTFGCSGTLSIASSGVQTGVNTTTAGAVPELGGSVDGLQTSMFSLDNTFHIVSQPAC